MEFTTPVGRMVYGSVFNGSDKDYKTGQPRLIKSGPNAGKPAMQWSFGVAYPKMLANGMPNEEFNVFFRTVIDIARTGYPQFFNGPIDPFTGKPGCTNPSLTFKIKDGDGFDKNGKPNNAKEGYAGHWVVSFSSMYAPRCFDIGKFAPEQQIHDQTRIKPGYFVAVSGEVKPNTGSETPGVYMNGNLVCLVGSGPEIVKGADAGTAFAGVAAGTLPAGCVVGATPANAPAVPLAPGAVPQVPAAPHDALAVAVANGWIPHPTSPGYYYKGQDVKAAGDVAALYPAPATAAVPVPPAPVIPPPPPVVPPAPAVGPTLTEAGQALGTYDSFKANGWDDAMMRQHGYLV